MTPLESILYMIWRGLAVGVLISAPMGPVGILCIQRTLDKGRHAGFYTGIGAAISDMFYCLLTGFGLSFIEDFIERNQNVIQLIGSIVLIAFSIYLFRKDPSSPMRRPVPQEVSMKKNVLGGFLFTFSNPLIIFLIIGLFARFNFTSPDIPGWAQAIGYLFIAVGALGWWFGITYAIEKVRSRFNMRSMKIMNITIGVVILCFAGVGIAGSIIGLTSHHANAASPLLHQYHRPSPPDTLGAATPLASPSGTSGAATFTLPASSELQLDFKLSHPGARPTLGQLSLPPWQITLICEAEGPEASPAPDRPYRAYTAYTPYSGCRRLSPSPQLTLRISLTHHSPTPIGPEPALLCDASIPGGICRIEPPGAAPGQPGEPRGSAPELQRREGILASGAAPGQPGGPRGSAPELQRREGILASGMLSEGVNLQGGRNHYRLSLDANTLTLLCGDRSLRPLISIPLTSPITVTEIRIEPAAAPDRPYMAYTAYPPYPDTAGLPAPPSPIAIEGAHLAYRPAPRRAHLPIHEITERCRLSADPLEGRWRILDWNLDQSRARRGGDYSLAIVRRSDGVYEIVYLEGAATNAGDWTPGMLKGELHPTGTPYTYRLIWHDAEGVPLTDDLTAQAYPTQQTLLLSFPHLAATLRLIRLSPF